ncbi:MAG: sporulation protein [Comamonadaceae bacterium PBBC1]|nr:MAG: sporulation protein [Comamonadaceae bacterium PBBC1]
MSLQSQRGGTFLGFIIGLVLGLTVAMSVAIYVTKVPTPFSNKNQPRTNDQDVQESHKNKDWNPNSVLQPKAAAEPPPLPEPTAVVTDDKHKDKVIEKPADKAPADTAKSEPRPAAVTADPLGDLAKAKTTLSTPAANASANDPFDYVVQAGAYRTSADADAQKAKLAMLGMDAKVSERDQGGRIVYRVRMGPFEDKNAAERARAKMDANGIDNTLVRLQR